ncbi:MAG: Uncharacterised protein [Flavobacterium sp. SCGC AAA160-P02]|nr:MAG: Uncharacterised protein [Flavobacterium sp. SCGC AAA160-P02]
MNILNKLRKPSLSIILASLVLFVSCEQHRLINDPPYKIDYSAFEEFKNTNIDLSHLINRSESSYDLSLAIEQEMNEMFNTSLNLPREFHELNHSGTILLEESRSRGWINDEKYELISEFYDDLSLNGSSTAISNYETKVINMNLTEEELNKETFFLNAMKSLEHLGTFDTSSSEYGDMEASCWWAIIVLIAAYVSLALCVTGLLCALAAIGYLSAGQYFVQECGE